MHTDGRPTLPLIVLAGSDRRPGTLPEDVQGLHSLSGYKGVDIEISGRALIDILLERLVESALFEPLYVAGPRQVYGETCGPAQVIDTDGSFGENIEAAITAATRDCPGRSLAITACDILPEVGELHRLFEDYYSNAPLDFWFPMILAPEGRQELGASAWKPEYRIAPRRGAGPRASLPGHVVVADPEAVRLPLVYSSFNLAYRSRNRPVLYRLWLILSHIFGGLLLQDLRHLLGLRLPTITLTVVVHSILLGVHLGKGTSTSEELAYRLRNIFVRYRHRRRYPERRGRLPLLEGLSLAKDIDTVEEAEEMVREME
ncbi:MAG: hypothetical protein GY769_16860 [bacterium]|nr:hypothetical protein [bacterium]